MPGLFGIFNNKSSLQKTQPLLNGCISNMLYCPHYVQETATSDLVAIGRVDIQKKFSRAIYHNENRQLIVCLWGDLFKVASKPLLENELSKKSPEAIIANLYCESGIKIAEQLNGDFNCAIYDGQKKKLFLINDRFGFRPLYIYHNPTHFLFSSEIKSFLPYSGLDKTVDWQSVSDYLRYGYVLGDRTLFKNIFMLPPATCLEVGCDGVKQVQYWRPRYSNSLTVDKIADAADQGYELFCRSMKRRLKGSKDVLVFLSGGLDSRLITGVASQSGVNITTATQGAFYSYEYRLAKQVCNILGISTPKRTQIQHKWMRQYLPDLAWQSEATYGSLGLAWQHGMAQTVGDDFDCMLNGIFGGHLSFGAPYFDYADLQSSRSHEDLVKRIDRGFNGHLYSRIQAVLEPKCRQRVDKFGLLTIREELERVKQQSDNQAFQQDAVFLYNRIRRGMISIDQNYIYFKDSYPFASYELFDFYLQLSPELLLDHRLYKELYKRHFPDLANVAWWSTGANLYKEINSAQKKIRNAADKIAWYAGRVSGGHLCLPHPWLVRHEEYNYRKDMKNREIISRILACKQCRDRNLYDQKEIQKLYDNATKGYGAMSHLGKLVMLELWFQYFVDEDPCLTTS